MLSLQKRLLLDYLFGLKAGVLLKKSSRMSENVAKPVSVFLLVLFATGCSTSQKLHWQSVNGPTKNAPQVYGKYSSGCLDGATTLPASSNTYQLMRIHRKRYYGHPKMMRFLQSFSEQIYLAKLGAIAIGDISQARGGPMNHGHKSHQIGLDADIWFKRFSQNEKTLLTQEDIENLPAISMANPQSRLIDLNNWDDQNVKVLKMAADYPEVERIFVHYTIKKYLCDKQDRGTWLKKIRPWWGHTHHFHIRLKCPEDNPYCRAQNPVDNQHGCDETLDWWFSEQAHQKVETAKIDRKPKLPAQCDKIYYD